MKTTQQNRFDMYISVDDYISKFESLLVNLIYFTENHLLLKQSIIDIRVTSKQQALNLKGMSSGKKLERKNLVLLTLKNADKLKSFANFNKDSVLLEQSKTTISKLDNLTDSKLISYSQNIFDKIAANLVKAQSYGVSDKTQSDLNNAIINFTKAEADINSARINHDLLTLKLVQLFIDGDAILAKIDDIVALIKFDEPEFYQGYLLARKIILTSQGSLNFKGLFLDAITGLPIKNVKAHFQLITIEGKPTTAKPLIKKSAKKGGIYLKNLTEGTYQLTVTYEGYQSQTFTIIINSGKITKITVKLVKN